MKTVIIGDIHGCASALSRLLERLRMDWRQDRLILLGDLFDRGPDSWGVYHLVRNLADNYGERFALLRGNHEDYLLRENLTLSQRLTWERVGRRATVKSFAEHGKRMEDTIPWLKENCRDFYRDDEIQCVHAGLLTEPIEVNDKDTMIHSHAVTLSNRYSGRLTVTGHIALRDPTWFAGDGETREALPWGEELPLPEKGILCIDTGCGKGGRLTGMALRGNTFLLESTGEGH